MSFPQMGWSYFDHCVSRMMPIADWNKNSYLGRPPPYPNSVYPWSQKGHSKVFVKRALLHENGTFTCALQYRGHFCNGALMHVLPCYSLFAPTLSPTPLFLSPTSPFLLSLTSPFSHPLVPPLFPLSHPSSVSHFFQHWKKASDLIWTCIRYS